MISVRTGERLLDYGGRVPPAAAREQLEGAVALHNILERERVAYLADEVGMGKTLVALGTVALYRHFDPTFRLLVIAPRENIQRKWIKEYRNFVANHVKIRDLRVKSIQGAPGRALVPCDNLIHLVREVAVDPDRDFFLRLTSFSLPVGDNTQLWKRKRDELLQWIGAIDTELLSLKQGKENFKDNYARAICCALPVFDLVIIDEGHNLKHGLRRGVAARNRVLAAILGHPSMGAPGFRGYGPRARRVLFLSATPVEDDYRQIWNQVDVVGLGDRVRELERSDLSDQEKREVIRRFLIRRVTGMTVAGKRLTKNLYRREWRGGGVEQHDDPLREPDERQRLIVALVQKKVTELISHERFNNSFQIGMLASFESFMETAKAIREEEEDLEVGNFDDPDQTDDQTERAGVDVGSLNRIAHSYRKTFGGEMPHPKMDAVVDSLARCFDSGQKALVFVRRIASVWELQRKLEDRYDEWLFRRLRAEAAESVRGDLERQIRRYEREHQERGHDRRIRYRQGRVDERAGTGDPESAGQGGFETFFAWFFRGEGPDGVLSGAAVQRRFSAQSGALCTFFSDNHVARLLGVEPGGVRSALIAHLGQDAGAVEAELQRRASALLPKVKKQQRRTVYLAVQEAALELIANADGVIGDKAKTILQERYRETTADESRTDLVSDPWSFLETRTFWTALSGRKELCERLWPEPRHEDFRDAFRERELRRELLSSMARLGNPFIDLYLLVVGRLGSLEMRARAEEDDDGVDPIDEYLDLLERQVAEGSGRLSAFRELAEAAANFDLILIVNAPDALEKRLREAATLFGQLLREQQPVGGMFGQVNQTLVRQFRMPGYPLVLLTTDLLQEGEDLHLFCSSVYHYGISWMPSSMEQRIGRIDRVASATERRLSRLDRAPEGHDLLQVLYPHLQETVEVLQVRRVLERMTSFIGLMHEDLKVEERESRQIDVVREIERGLREIEPIREVLKSAYPVREEMLEGEDRGPVVGESFADRILARFERLREGLKRSAFIRWDTTASRGTMVGSISFGRRTQPFRLELRSMDGQLFVHCVSPIQSCAIADLNEAQMVRMRRSVTIEGLANGDGREILLSAEGDVLLAQEEVDLARVDWLLRRVTRHADEIEKAVFGTDEPIETFGGRLKNEGDGAGEVDGTGDGSRADD